MDEKEYKYFQILVGDWKLFVVLPSDTRILQEYELREIPGTFVKALYMGDPLIDLEMVLDKKDSKKSFGVLLPNLPGILVDDVTDYTGDVTEVAISDAISRNSTGILIEKCAKTTDGLFPILSLEKLFSVEFTVKIDEEISNRRWI